LSDEMADATAQRGRVSTCSRRNSTLRNFHVPSIRTAVPDPEPACQKWSYIQLRIDELK